MADPAAFIDNPFTALGAIAGPAVLTNACSVLALGTSNRLGRVVDRTRIVVKEMRALVADDPELRTMANQLATLEQRGFVLVAALRNFYAALGLFAAAALLSAIGSVLALYGQRLMFETAAVAALLSGSAAVIALVLGCVRMVGETRMALRGLTEEASARSDLRSRPL